MKVLFEITEYQEQYQTLKMMQKVDVKLNLKIHIDSKDQPQVKKYFQISLNEFGTITGSFSLSEVDTMIENLQKI